MLDSYDSNFVLSATDTLAYGDRAAEEERFFSRETRALLDSICASVSDVVEDFEVEIADFAADFDEISERYF